MELRHVWNISGLATKALSSLHCWCNASHTFRLILLISGKHCCFFLAMFGVLSEIQQKLNVPFIADVTTVVILDIYCIFLFLEDILFFWSYCSFPFLRMKWRLVTSHVRPKASWILICSKMCYLKKHGICKCSWRYLFWLDIVRGWGNKMSGRGGNLSRSWR